MPVLRALRNQSGTSHKLSRELVENSAENRAKLTKPTKLTRRVA